MIKKIIYPLIILLVFCGGIVIYTLFFRPIAIYQMPINAWNRKVWSAPNPTQKEESFVVYNSMWKSEHEIYDSIIAFNDRTICLDTINKYIKGYTRMFFKKTTTLNKHYQEAEDGSDIIYDYADERILLITWKLIEDMIEIKVGGKYYRLPANINETNLIRSIYLLQNRIEYLYYEYKR